MGPDKIRVRLRGPNQNRRSYEPSVSAVLCSCSPQTLSLGFAGTGKGQAEFFLAHFACKCNFPSCSSLKLLFPGLAFVYFSHAAQVSLISVFIPFFYHGMHLKQCFHSQPTPCAVAPGLLLLAFKPWRGMRSEPLQMGEEAAPASVSFLPQSSDESFDRGGQEEQKPFCSRWSGRG